jgi:hypothetical protein
MSKCLVLFVLFYAALLTAQDKLPDNPEPQKKTAHFFTFRQSWQDPALRPSKKCWGMFVGLHAALGVTYAVDYHVTHGVREAPASEVPAILAVTGFDFLMFKLISPSLSWEGSVYAIQHYARDIH